MNMNFEKKAIKKKLLLEIMALKEHEEVLNKILKDEELKNLHGSFICSTLLEKVLKKFSENISVQTGLTNPNSYKLLLPKECRHKNKFPDCYDSDYDCFQISLNFKDELFDYYTFEDVIKAKRYQAELETLDETFLEYLDLKRQMDRFKTEHISIVTKELVF